MDVRAVDTSATGGRSRLHRASPLTKIAAFALLLGAVVVQHNVLIVLAVTLAVGAAAVASRLPLRLVFGLAGYPAVFAVVFAFAAAPDALTGALFVAKATGAALCAVVLVCTTPYPQVFAPLQRVVPEVVGDAMLMTYRALFLLAEKFDHLRTAVRLRSGISRHQPLRAARATVSALGGLVLYALDLSQREYDVMRLRGYEGRLRATLPPAASPLFDVALLATAATILGTAVTFRLAGPALTPYSWMPAVVALLACLIAAVWRMTAR